MSGPVVKSGVHAGLSSRRSRVQIPSGPLAGRFMFTVERQLATITVERQLATITVE